MKICSNILYLKTKFEKFINLNYGTVILNILENLYYIKIYINSNLNKTETTKKNRKDMKKIRVTLPLLQ